uniref:Ycf45 n=1 Tax=Pseudopedinella elastica TaxID=35684 RepID=A0A516ZAG7_9STRA|nr:Ycf45 [Pseudopedinella elastica]QDR24679.1 Ycf45 [Pseudopedinella elastica]|tara:strand:+ start:320 stop:1831 length:1512 start_codon:yes stop_codon:yes gene_type:complete
MQIKEDLDRLIEILPKSIQKIIQNHPKKDTLIEIVMDLGRRPEARFLDHPEYLSPKIITWQDLDYSVKRLSKFTDDNRAGIEKTLHRISCIRNRQGLIIGLTCRVGRALYGTINIIRDLLESKKSILILGKPGVGKTTMVREIARVLANEMEKRVVIIDTSNEIAGDSDVPHIGIGRARRMQVEKTELQHKVMIEGVENHMPEVIIIDEIGTELEALAAQTIAERGVQLIGTAHGNFLGSLIKNPVLSDLVGGIQSVTLSDEEARRRGTQKSIIERKGLPAFQLAIELNERNSWTIHEDVENSIDSLLQGLEPKLQVRKVNNDKNIQIYLTNSPQFLKPKTLISNKNWRKSKTIDSKLPFKKVTNSDSEVRKLKLDELKTFLLNAKETEKHLNIYPYSVSTKVLEGKIKKLNLNLRITNDLNKANIIIGLSFHIIRNRLLMKVLQERKIMLLLVSSNSNEIITETLLKFKKKDRSATLSLGFKKRQRLATFNKRRARNSSKSK